MLSKVLRGTAIVLGVLLIAAAFVLAFVITPNYVARLPDDTDAKRSYTGTFASILDAQALAQGNSAAAFKHNVPVSVEREVRVLKTSDDSALVSDARTTAAAGTPVEKTVWNFALDRRSLEPVGTHPKDWPDVIDAHGLTVSWPFGADKKSYTGWVPESATTTSVDFRRTENTSGLDAYVYQAKINATRISDAQVLAGLPKALPQSLLKPLAASLPGTAEAKQQLAQLLPTLSDPVPLSYTIAGTDTFWVEPETGVVVDLERTQQRVAGIVVPKSGAFVPLVPVVDVSYRQTPDAVRAAVDDAKDGRSGIRLVGTTLPIVIGVVGALLLLAGLLLRRRRPRGPVTGAGPDAGPTTEPTAHL